MADFPEIRGRICYFLHSSLELQQFVKLKLDRKKKMLKLNVASSWHHYYIWKQMLLEFEWEGECKFSILYTSSELHTVPASAHCLCTPLVFINYVLTCALCHYQIQAPCQHTGRLIQSWLRWRHSRTPSHQRCIYLGK